MPTAEIEESNTKLTKRQRGNGLLAIGLFVPALLIGMIVSVLGLIALGVPERTASVLSAFFGESLAILVVFMVLHDSQNTFKSTLSLRKASVKSVLLGIMSGVLLYGALIVTSAFIPAEDGGFTSDTSALFFSSTGFEAIFLLFIVVPFLAPMFEEFALRGAFRNAFQSGFGGGKAAAYWAIVVSAVLFSLMHFQGMRTWFDVIPLVVSLTLGLISGLLVYKSNSIWPGIALHVTYNLTTVLVAFAFS